MPCLLVSLALGQTERTETPPANPPPAATTTTANDAVLRALDGAQRELRWLLDRNAALEKAMAEERQEHARQVAVLGEQAEAQRRRAAEELTQLRASFDRQRAAMRADAEAARAQAAQERARLEASSQDTVAALRREAAALEAAHRRDTGGLRDENRALTARLDAARQPTAPVARDAAASPRAAEPGTRERPARRCTPTRSAFVVNVQRVAPPADPDQPAPGTRTPRRRGKID